MKGFFGVVNTRQRSAMLKNSQLILIMPALKSSIINGGITGRYRILIRSRCCVISLISVIRFYPSPIYHKNVVTNSYILTLVG